MLSDEECAAFPLYVPSDLLVYCTSLFLPNFNQQELAITSLLGTLGTVSDDHGRSRIMGGLGECLGVGSDV